jgi:adenylate cyclase
MRVVRYTKNMSKTNLNNEPLTSSEPIFVAAKKKIRKTVFRTYVLVPVLANVLTILLVNFVLIDFLIQPETRWEHVGFLPLWVTLLVGEFLPFATVTVIMTRHLKPFETFFRIETPNRAELFLVRKRVLSAPIILSRMSLVGWGVGVFGSFILMPFQFHITPVIRYLPIFLRSSIFWITFGGACAGISYYAVDYFNQKLIIPFFFEGNQLSKFKEKLKVSIQFRVLIFFFTTTVYPMFIYLNAFAKMIVRPDAPLPIKKLGLVTFIFLGIGSLLTYLLGQMFQKPLISMSAAVDAIKEENYDVIVPVRSVDEIGTLGEGINRMATELKEKEQMKNTFGKIVDPSVRDYLLSQEDHLGGQVVPATILFSDIRNFTASSEKMAPEQVVEWLNLYFTEMTTAVSDNKGVVNKYIGDAVMAVFGAPLPLENHAESAVKTAIDMIKRLTDLNIKLKKDGFPTIDIGIGIHSGTVLAGNIGSNQRMEYTVIGDTVNTASRIEGLCKTYKKSILISEATQALIPDEINHTFLDSALVKGKKEKLKVYTV